MKSILPEIKKKNEKTDILQKDEKKKNTDLKANFNP